MLQECWASTVIFIEIFSQCGYILTYEPLSTTSTLVTHIECSDIFLSNDISTIFKQVYLFLKYVTIWLFKLMGYDSAWDTIMHEDIRFLKFILLTRFDRFVYNNLLLV